MNPVSCFVDIFHSLVVRPCGVGREVEWRGGAAATLPRRYRDQWSGQAALRYASQVDPARPSRPVPHRGIANQDHTPGQGGGGASWHGAIWTVLCFRSAPESHVSEPCSVVALTAAEVCVGGGKGSVKGVGGRGGGW